MEKISKSTLNKILTSEGGFNDNEPEHVGGMSFAGITQQAYMLFLKSPAGKLIKDPPPTVRGLGGSSVTDKKWKYCNPLDIPEEFGVRTDIIKSFYQDYYLPQFHVDELPECLQYIHADFAINAGSKATKIIQTMIGADVDGVWGSGTSRAVAAFFETFDQDVEIDPDYDNRLILGYDDHKREHYEYLAEKNPAKFGENLPGWLKRCTHVVSELQEYFEDEHPTPKAIDEDDEFLTQADGVDPEAITAAVLEKVTQALPSIIAEVLEGYDS